VVVVALDDAKRQLCRCPEIVLVGELRIIVEYSTEFNILVPFVESAHRLGGVADATDSERAEMSTALQPQIPEKLIERLERGIRCDLEMNPEVRAIRTLRSKVKCVLLTLYVVTATRPQVVAHSLVGVLLVTQGTSPLGSLFGHTPFFEYQQDKSCLNSTNGSVVSIWLLVRGPLS
jgi:hypothetical protein